jgi:hypothetical protein
VGSGLAVAVGLAVALAVAVAVAVAVGLAVAVALAVGLAVALAVAVGLALMAPPPYLYFCAKAAGASSRRSTALTANTSKTFFMNHLLYLKQIPSLKGSTHLSFSDIVGLSYNRGQPVLLLIFDLTQPRRRSGVL